MADGLNSVNSRAVAEIIRPSGYQAESVREVRARASVLDQKHTEEERRHLRRLNTVLAQGQPPREDVPRGYYLNIKV